jgi:hypothetical protein
LRRSWYQEAWGQGDEQSHLPSWFFLGSLCCCHGHGLHLEGHACAVVVFVIIVVIAVIVVVVVIVVVIVLVVGVIGSSGDVLGIVIRVALLLAF